VRQFLIIITAILLSACSPIVRNQQISKDEYLITGSSVYTFARQDVVAEAQRLCGEYTILQMSGDKYGDLNNLHIKCK
jgi:uncharacterized protein YceK